MDLSTKGVLRKHTTSIEDNKETYVIKLKDRIDKSGFKIWDKKPMILKEIRIIKIPRQNNMLMIELIK